MNHPILADQEAQTDNIGVQIIEPEICRDPLLEQEIVLQSSTQKSSQKYDILLQSFKESALKLALNIYSNPKLPVSGAESVISDIQTLIVNPMIEIIQEVCPNSLKIVDLKNELSKYSSE